MSLLKTNEIQNYNGSSLTLTASTVSTSAQLNTGGNISVTGSLNVSDDSTTRTNLGLGTIATQDSDSITVTGGSVTGTEIDLKSSGTTIFASDGTTAVLSESGGAVTFTANTAVIEGSSSGDLVRITQTGSGNALVVEDSTNPDSSPFVVDATGTIISGASSSYVFAGSIVPPRIQVQSLGGGDSSINATSWASGVNVQATVILARSEGNSVGSHTVVDNGDNLGKLSFQGSDGTAFIEAAKIESFSDGTPGTNDMPGRLVFSTTADGASSPTERMRIDSSGNVGIGNFTPTVALDVRSADDTQIEIENTGAGGGFIGVDSSNVMNIGRFGPVDLAFKTNNTERMRIDSSGAITMPDVYSDTVTGRDLYISSSGQLGYVSSIRSSKTNIENLPSISWLYELTPVKFQYRTKDEDGNYTDEADSEIQYGFIAEDVVEVNSDLVFGDETENGFELRGIQYSRLIAPMIKAIQEQQTLIESQQSQIDALTARIEALETT